MTRTSAAVKPQGSALAQHQWMRIFARRGGSMRSRYRDRFEAGAVLAALRGLRQQSPARVIVAVPVAAPETCELMEDEADDVVCAATPEPFHAVGLWYEDFEQTSDEEVRELLERAREERRDARAQGAGEVQVDVAAGDRVALEGDLAVPEGAIGVVLFAHGSGSGRHRPRKRPGARALLRLPPGNLLTHPLHPPESEAGTTPHTYRS